ncbi:hypothetical protein J3E68DRAFT_443369 [Trichoderma sp. SZMC 28012]
MKSFIAGTFILSSMSPILAADTCYFAAVTSASGFANLGGSAGSSGYGGFIWQHEGDGWQSISPEWGNGFPSDYHYDCNENGGAYIVDPRGTATAMCIICDDRNGLCLPGGNWHCKGMYGQPGDVYINSKFAGIADGTQTVCLVQYACK